MLNDFEIEKAKDDLEELKKLEERSFEQNEQIFRLRKRLARAEKNILGYTLETGDNGKER